MTDIAASFGLWQMNFVDTWHSDRKNYVDQYRNYFNSIEGVKTQGTESKIEINAYHLFIISINPNKWKINRNKLISLLNEYGIGTSVHYIPIHMHSYYIDKYGYSENDFPNATHFSKNVISLPLYPALSKKDIDYIIEKFDIIWKKYSI